MNRPCLLRSKFNNPASQSACQLKKSCEEEWHFSLNLPIFPIASPSISYRWEAKSCWWLWVRFNWWKWETMRRGHFLFMKTRNEMKIYDLNLILILVTNTSLRLSIWSTQARGGFWHFRAENARLQSEILNLKTQLKAAVGGGGKVFLRKTLKQIKGYYFSIALLMYPV